MKYSIGDKVVPMSKTVTYMKPLEQCDYWKRAKTCGQDYLYVVGVDRRDYVLHNEAPKGYDHTKDFNENVENGYRCMGDYFRELDLINYQ